MKIFPTNGYFDGCRLWVECGNISVADNFDYRVEVDKPLIVLKKSIATEPIERAENVKETK